MRPFIVLGITLTVLLFGQSARAVTYIGTGDNSATVTVDISPQVFHKPSGKSEIRIPGIWTYAKGTVSFNNGIIYSVSWTDYPKDASNLYENDIAHGASMAVLYALPSMFCSQGALINAIMELPASTNVSDLGLKISLTPVSGSVCGEQVSSMSTMSLTYVVAKISGAPTTPTPVPTTPPIDISGSWGGTWTSKLGANGTLSGSITQTGYTLTGAMVLVGSPCFAGSTSITGNIIGGQVTFSGSTLQFSGKVKDGGATLAGAYSINSSVIANCPSDSGEITLLKK